VTAVTTEPGMVERLDRLLSLPRVRVNGGASLADLIAGLEDRRVQAVRIPHSRSLLHQRVRQ
ncbi:MAG TPA: hypothetical protein VKE41_23800, partial [Roseiflexaceae bacterium]|nr:hypothetical protein [Roseiflexaceae bacterium]